MANKKNRLPCRQEDKAEFLAMENSLFESLVKVLLEFENKCPQTGLAYNAKMTAVARIFFCASGETDKKEARDICRLFLAGTYSFILAEAEEVVRS